MRLREKDKLVLQGLVHHVDLTDVELAEKIGVKRPTLTGIKNKLLHDGVIQQTVIPNFQSLGCEVLRIMVGSFSSSIDLAGMGSLYQNSARQFPEIVYSISSKRYFFAVLVGQSYTDVDDASEGFIRKLELNNILDSSESLDFSFKRSSLSQLFNYSQLLADCFKLKAVGSMSEPFNAPIQRKVSGNEALVLEAVVSNPFGADALIARKTGLDRMTVRRIKSNLLKDGFYRNARIPSISSAGLNLQVAAIFKLDHNFKGRKMGFEKTYFGSRKPIFLVYDGRKGVYLDAFEDADRKELNTKKLNAKNIKHTILRGDVQEYAFRNEDVVNETMSFAPLIQKLLGLRRGT